MYWIKQKSDILGTNYVPGAVIGTSYRSSLILMAITLWGRIATQFYTLANWGSAAEAEH